MNDSRPIVYISGPITKGDRNHNVYQAFDAQRKLMDAGFAPINPMASTCFPFAWEEKYDAATWLECDFPMIAASAALLRLPGESDGAEKEVCYAELIGCPVYHDLSDLCADIASVRNPLVAADRLELLTFQAGEWSDETFGDSWSDGDQAGLPTLHHLHEEIDEIIESPDDLSEWADAFMLLLDAARRRNISISELIDATHDKLAVNRRRKWGKPDENGVVHHVAEDAEP